MPLRSQELVQAQFRTNDPVRLVESHGTHPAGARGRIVGRFARTDPTWLVSFSDEEPSIEVRGDQIAVSTAEKGKAPGSGLFSSRGAEIRTRDL